MADLPYVKNTGKIADYFNKIQEVGRPMTASHQWLQSVGFTSSNDRFLIAFLRDLGFADASGKPTRRWTEYRHRDHSRSVMAAAIRETYSDLFQLYDDAYTKGDGDIRNWMRTYADQASPTTVDRALASFRALCKLAEFGPEEPGPAVTLDAVGATAAPPLDASRSIAAAPPASSPAPSVHINVELHLPASASAEDYEAFFSAMRKHLFDGSAAAG